MSCLTTKVEFNYVPIDLRKVMDERMNLNDCFPLPIDEFTKVVAREKDVARAICRSLALQQLACLP